ncbi:iron-containing alcohol dehydrogenase [Allobacillus sp. GCM10007489]|uniref:iron-containing alcohol dehydrogenase n=1 Tax=unclassified Allobacillus TaxID=2628859 RepID=UPI00164257B5|nr:iron-containing alcohol dehydrogenase [Allobacillus sp. SKP2-8]
MYQLYYRTYQMALRSVSKFLPWREPKVFSGYNSINQLVPFLVENDLHRLLVVTDKGISKIGLMSNLLEQMKDKQIAAFIYDDTVPNPTITNIEEAYTMYKENQCQAIIAFGGGSPIDCAKAVLAKLAKPNQSIANMRGLMKIRKRESFLIAVPTTAGTGSEATLAAVISDPSNQEKYPLMDPVLIPDVAVLDPLLTKNLPPHLTATTGMDALTHAIEVYIGKNMTNETREASRKAIQLVFENIYIAYKDGSNLEARKNMLEASYLAGFAFTRSYVGNVHAIAHTLGAFYNTPHGLANAIILPHVLQYYREIVYERLAELSDLIKVSEQTEPIDEKANRFIEEIKRLNQRMELPDHLPEIRDEDLPQMIARAHREANPLYPVPKVFTKKDFEQVYKMIRG